MLVHMHICLPVHMPACAYAFDQVSKLINPAELEHKEISRGLADSLFGQGKMNEGKRVMSSGGLTDKAGKGSMPSSYLRCAYVGARVGRSGWWVHAIWSFSGRGWELLSRFHDRGHMLLWMGRRE